MGSGGSSDIRYWIGLTSGSSTRRYVSRWSPSPAGAPISMTSGGSVCARNMINRRCPANGPPLNSTRTTRCDCGLSFMRTMTSIVLERHTSREVLRPAVVRGEHRSRSVLGMAVLGGSTRSLPPRAAPRVAPNTDRSKHYARPFPQRRRRPTRRAHSPRPARTVTAVSRTRGLRERGLSARRPVRRVLAAPRSMVYPNRFGRARLGSRQRRAVKVCG